MTDDEPVPIDTDRLDEQTLADLASFDNDTEIYASEYWLQTVEDGLPPTASTLWTFDPDSYDDPAEWLSDEIAALFVAAHRETDLGVLGVLGVFHGTTDGLSNTASIGIERHATELGVFEEYFEMDDSDDEFPPGVL